MTRTAEDRNEPEEARALSLSRLVDAPVDLVWRAWTEPEHLVKWWGPRGFVNEVDEIRIEEGGVWRFVMRGADGKDYRNRLMYDAIEPKTRIAYRIDDDGETDNPPFAAEATFEPKGDKTLLTKRIVFDSVKTREGALKFGAVEGGRSTLDKLEDELAAMKAEPLSLTITRVFHAPRALVWKCWTDPVHGVAWGPDDFEMQYLSGKPEKGAPWRMRLVPKDGGKPMLQSGVYREYDEPERLVMTFGWENDAGEVENETLIELTFKEEDGKTTMHFVQSGFTGEKERDGHGVGWSEAFDAMAAYLGKLGG